MGPDLVLALVFSAAFGVVAVGNFARDVVIALPVVMAGSIAASLWREVFRQPVLPLDQHICFAIGALLALLVVRLLTKVRRNPSLLAGLLVLWLGLELLALLYLRRPASARDYIEQQTMAYFAALMTAWLAAGHLRYPTAR